MKSTVVLITTNLPNPKFSYLEKAIAQICYHRTDFVKDMLLCVDMFNDGKRGRKYFEQFESNGWKVIIGKGGSRRGMAENQLRGIEAATSEWVILCEDDSFINKIPDIKFMDEVTSTANIEALCYNAGVYGTPPPSTNMERRLLAYINNSNNYTIIRNDSILRKRIELCDAYYTPFPGLIIKKEYILNMHRKAQGCKKPIELGLSDAWKALYPNKGVGIYLRKPDFTKSLTLQTLHDIANISYWNNDVSLRHPNVRKKKHIWM